MAVGRMAVELAAFVATAAVLTACTRMATRSPYRVQDTREWLARSSVPQPKATVTTEPAASIEPHNIGQEAVDEAPANDPPGPEPESSSVTGADGSQPARHRDGTRPHAKSLTPTDGTDDAGLEREPTVVAQHVSLDFRDTNIRDVLRVLAAVSGLNIVVTDEVNKDITVHLEDVPWDEALEILLESNQLGKQRKGNVLLVSTVKRLASDRISRVESVRTAGLERDTELKAEALGSRFLTLNYTQATELAKNIKPMLSNRGVAIAYNATNTLFVRDVKRVLDLAVELASQFDTRPVQVLIESNLIETTPTFAQALGMELAFTAGKTMVDSAFAAAQPFSTAAGATLSIIGAKMGPFSDINTTLSAAEQQGKVRIISRPSVVTLNNVPSTIESLRVIHVSLPTGSTNIATGANAQQGQALATEKIPVGITLTVTPQVSKDDYIMLSIKVKSSSVGAASTPNGVPDELAREAISNVIVHDGQTVVIGGIIKETSQKNQAGVPYLKEIPVLGWLFKRVDQEKDLEELMVFITPRIATGSAHDLAGAEQHWRENMKTTGEPTSLGHTGVEQWRDRQ